MGEEEVIKNYQKNQSAWPFKKNDIYIVLYITFTMIVLLLTENLTLAKIVCETKTARKLPFYNLLNTVTFNSDID